MTDERDGPGSEVGVVARILTPDLWDDLVRVLSPTGGCDGCWCFNHHIPPGEPDVRDDAARAAKERAVRAGRASGVIGYLYDKPVAWCAVDRRRDIPGHDCVTQTDDDATGGVWAIHCFYTQRHARGRGVARVLLRTTLEWLRESGAEQVEAFPSPPESEPFFGGFGGPFALYAQAGFERAGDFDENFCRVVRTL